MKIINKIVNITIKSVIVVLLTCYFIYLPTNTKCVVEKIRLEITQIKQFQMQITQFCNTFPFKILSQQRN